MIPYFIVKKEAIICIARRDITHRWAQTGARARRIQARDSFLSVAFGKWKIRSLLQTLDKYKQFWGVLDTGVLG